MKAIPPSPSGTHPVKKQPMNHAKPNPAPPRPWIAVLMLAGFIGLVTFVGTFFAWSGLIIWLPQETVPVEIVDSEEGVSGFMPGRGVSTRSSSITTVEPDGTRQHISCPKATYNAMTKGYGIGYSVKLVRNTRFKTPIAFLRQPESFVKYPKGSLLEKLSTKTPPKPPERFPLARFHIVRVIVGTALFGCAVYMFRIFPRLHVSLPFSIPVAIICFLAGIALGIAGS